MSIKYDAAFCDMELCKPLHINGRNMSARHLYILKFDFEKLGCSRVDFMGQLKENGIGTQVHYMPVPAHPFYRKLGFRPENYPNALQYYKQATSIPLFYELTDIQQLEIIQKIKELLN